jgi:hypothetical protein
LRIREHLRIEPNRELDRVIPKARVRVGDQRVFGPVLCLRTDQAELGLRLENVFRLGPVERRTRIDRLAFDGERAAPADIGDAERGERIPL